MKNTYNNTIALPMNLVTKAFVVVGMFISVSVSGAQADTFSSTKVIDLVNQSRLEAGLNTLTENSKLTQAAQDKANDMIQNDYFAHTSPKGVTPWFWLKKEGYTPKSAGENLAINFTTAKSQHEGWMASKTHRDNILSPKYKEIGVAVVEGKIDGEKSLITVQFFGTLAMGVVAGKTITTTEELTPVAVVSEVPVLMTQEVATGISHAVESPETTIVQSEVATLRYPFIPVAFLSLFILDLGVLMTRVYITLLENCARYIAVMSILRSGNSIHKKSLIV
jgi:uncharacterized protein YkwD